MWEFPCQEIVGHADADEILRQLLQNYQDDEDVKYIGKIRHVYSHFRLEVEIYKSRAQRNTKIAENDSFWHDAVKLADSPLHGAHQKVLKLMLKEVNK